MDPSTSYYISIASGDMSYASYKDNASEWYLNGYTQT